MPNLNFKMVGGGFTQPPLVPSVGTKHLGTARVKRQEEAIFTFFCMRERLGRHEEKSVPKMANFELEWNLQLVDITATASAGSSLIAP